MSVYAWREDIGGTMENCHKDVSCGNFDFLHILRYLLPPIHLANMHTLPLLLSLPSDELKRNEEDGGLAHPARAGAAYNIGIMVFRPTSHDLVKEWLDTILVRPVLHAHNFAGKLCLFRSPCMRHCHRATQSLKFCKRIWK